MAVEIANRSDPGLEKRKRPNLWARFRHNKGALLSFNVLLYIVITTSRTVLFNLQSIPDEPAGACSPSLTPLEEGAKPHILGTDQQEGRLQPFARQPGYLEYRLTEPPGLS